MTWDNELLGPLRYEELRAELIQMGIVGWEVVSVYASNGWHYAALRRPNKVAVAPPTVQPRGKRVQE